MVTVASLAVLVLVVALAFRGLRYPAVASALFLSMFSLEQVVFAGFAFRGASWLVNVVVASVCAVLVAVALVRGRRLQIDWLAIVLVVALVGLTVLSMMWTRSPLAAERALLTFIPGVIVGCLIGASVLNTPDDVRRLISSVILIALLVGVVVLAARVPGIGGRVLIVDQGTVLSPSKFMGFAVIALLCSNRWLLPWSMVVRVGMAAFLLGVIFVMGARAQFVFALGIGAVAGYFSGVLNGRALGIAGGLAIVGILTPLVEVILGGEQIEAVSRRYTTESIGEGWRVRYDMIMSCLTLSAPIFGHGVMDWAYHVSQRDQYLYPHNSLAQLYFEVGLVGLSLFAAILVRAGMAGKVLLKRFPLNSNWYGAALVLVAYLAYEFLISQKQETFMACLGLYMFAVALAGMRKGAPRALGTTSHANKSAISRSQVAPIA